MDLIATRGVFGDFGRLTKGAVVKNVPKQQAEKMIKTSAYAEATADALKAAKAPKKVIGAKAKAAANNKAGTSIDSKAVEAAVREAVKELRDDFNGTIKTNNETLKAISEEVASLRQQLADTEKTHAEAISRLVSLVETKPDADGSAAS